MSHMQPRAGSADDTPPAALVRAELARILASAIFSRSDRLSAFLTFIVERTLSGHGDSLKEQVLANELYGKGTDFNTAADPIVRVDARRLRDKLREYYASAPVGPIVISVPKGSYTPLFGVGALGTAPTPDPVPASGEAVAVAVYDALPERPGAVSRIDTRPSLWRRSWIAVAVVVAIGAATWLVTSLRLGPRDVAPAIRVLTVTSFPGAEEDPSFSPDGNFVAFSWSGTDASVTAGLWVKAVDGDALRRLTETPDAHDTWPAWSPDGREVVFTRLRNGLPSIFLVSALGGPARMIAERGAQATWLPDGRSLVMTRRTPDGHFGLVHHVVATGQRRNLSLAPSGFADLQPRVSPDGTTLAFARIGLGKAALFVMPLSGGDQTQRTDWTVGVIGGLSWTPDGREILFAQPGLSGRRLQRVPANGSAAGTAVADLPLGAVAPATSRLRPGGSFRVAFVYGHAEVGLRMIDLHAGRDGPTMTAVTPFCDATRSDVPGRFSPDGTQVAFTSDRSGSSQLWVAGRDGSHLRSVTNLPDASIVVGSWSPDGRRVAFDATVGGNTDIYVVGADGGPVTRLTHGKASEIDPEWSRDGRWIYYASDETGRSEIWKMDTGGGQPGRLTSEGGIEPREAPDGRTVYFLAAQRWSLLGSGYPLKQVSTQGGPTSLVQAGVYAGAWSVTDAGIVFLTTSSGLADASGVPAVLALYDFSERRVRRLGELPFRIGSMRADRFLTVSRDGRWAVASHLDRYERDVLVADNFR
jgi:Tol biopolymer transport system component